MASAGGNLPKINPSMTVFKKGNEPRTFDWQTKEDDWKKLFRSGPPLQNIYFVVHGFNDSPDSAWMTGMKNALLANVDPTPCVVLVGWKDGASMTNVPPYIKAAENMEKVGSWLGPYVRSLKEVFPRAHLHGIGHSLGAHLLGFAARSGKKSFARITGLDPAGPLFERKNPNKMLCDKDAEMVDVIHTDGYYTTEGPVPSIFDTGLVVNHFGTLLPLGTVDFYPNYGTSLQPGTGSYSVGASHSRAHEFFTWSISNRGQFKTKQVLAKPPKFEAPVYDLQDAMGAEMGFYADHKSTGNYYIKTNGAAPWAPV